jgi:hypothetical protein
VHTGINLEDQLARRFQYVFISHKLQCLILGVLHSHSAGLDSAFYNGGQIVMTVLTVITGTELVGPPELSPIAAKGYLAKAVLSGELISLALVSDKSIRRY